jgi:2-polyprenyl-6-hydroxyphenyl methylase/3-demethylubiquinone-9 3-methyltransferase
MRWLPKGTHDWSKFLTPNELSKLLESSGLKLVDKKGFYFDKVSWTWSISNNDLSINYVTASVR